MKHPAISNTHPSPSRPKWLLPTSAIYYALQSSTNLAPAPVTWKNDTNGVATLNRTDRVIILMSGGRSFFRLDPQG